VRNAGRRDLVKAGPSPLDFVDLRFTESYAAATVSIGKLLSARSLLTSTDAPDLGFEFQNGQPGSEKCIPSLDDRNGHAVAEAEDAVGPQSSFKKLDVRSNKFPRGPELSQAVGSELPGGTCVPPFRPTGERPRIGSRRLDRHPQWPACSPDRFSSRGVGGHAGKDRADEQAEDAGRQSLPQSHVQSPDGHRHLVLKAIQHSGASCRRASPCGKHDLRRRLQRNDHETQ